MYSSDSCFGGDTFAQWTQELGISQLGDHTITVVYHMTDALEALAKWR